MATEFNYTMADVNIAQLQDEIQASSITVATDRIDKSGDDIDIHFKADLSAGEETTLDTLTTDHVAGPVVAEKNPVLVHEVNVETGEVEPVPFVASEGRNRVLASTKPVIPGKVLYFHWTGVSDDVSGDNTVVGAGGVCMVELSAQDTTKSVDMYFGNYKHGELVYIAGGAFQWEGSDFGDLISMIVMASATPTQQSTNLDFNVDGEDRLIATAPGTGTHGLAGTPVFVPNYCNKGYWNLTPEWQPEFVPGMTGMFDWFTVEREAARFVNKLPLFGTETKGMQLSSPETSQLPHGYFLRVECESGGGNGWKLVGSVMLYREIVGACAGL
jgi:hypothetical protein